MLLRRLTKRNDEIFLNDVELQGVYGLQAANICGKFVSKSYSELNTPTIRIIGKLKIGNTEQEIYKRSEEICDMVKGEYVMDFKIGLDAGLPDSIQHGEFQVFYEVEGIAYKRGRIVYTQKEVIEIRRFWPLGSEGEQQAWAGQDLVVRLPREALLVPGAIVPVHASETVWLRAELHETLHLSHKSDTKVLCEAEGYGSVDLTVPETCGSVDAGLACISHKILVSIDHVRIVEACIITNQSALVLQQHAQMASAAELEEANRALSVFRNWARSCLDDRVARIQPASPLPVVSAQRPPSILVRSMSMLSRRSVQLPPTPPPTIEAPPVIASFRILPQQGRKGLVLGLHGCGAKVTGVVNLDFHGGVCGRHLQLKLSGEAFISNGGPKHTLIDIQVVLWEGSGDSANISNTNIIPFSFDLPDELPESCRLDGNRGGVCYNLEAEFTHVSVGGLERHTATCNVELVRCIMGESSATIAEMQIPCRVISPGQSVSVELPDAKLQLQLIQDTQFRHRFGAFGPAARESVVLAEARGTGKVAVNRPESESTVVDAVLLEIRHRLRIRVDESWECWVPVVFSNVESSVANNILPRLSAPQQQALQQWVDRVLNDNVSWWL